MTETLAVKDTTPAEIRIPLTDAQYDRMKEFLVDRMSVEMELAAYAARIIGRSETPQARGEFARIEPSHVGQSAALVLWAPEESA